MQAKREKKSIIMTMIITALITGSVVWGFMTYGNQGPDHTDGPNDSATTDQPENSSAGDRKIIYWRAPMDPMEIYDEPGKSKMGMDLVPVYEDEVSGGSENTDRKIVYWKAPMDPTEIYEQPGKSKMGMDLVPVYEDELVGGVDIKIDPVVEQNMGLKLETAEKGPLNHTIKTYGHITIDETRTGIVSQKAGGWIEKLYADYTGLYVEKGQPLYEIYSPSLIASQEEYLSAFKNYTKNRTALNREILDSAKNRLSYFDIAEKEILAVEKSEKINKTVLIRSPYTGVITHKNVTEGVFAKAGLNLFTISDLSHVWVEAHIFEYEQNLISEGQEVEMSLSYKPDKVYTGKIFYIFPYLQKKTRDVIIRVAFENMNGELKPDMYTRIKIRAQQLGEGLSISSQAVIHSGEKQIVFVAKGDGKFTPREVKTGVYLDGGRVQILSGLMPGDQVVVSGQFLLDSESKLKEAVRKMIESKSGNSETVVGDDFFDDMESDDDFFEDME